MSNSTGRHLAENANCPPVLYKYCTIATAESIFQSGLRLNSMMGFNDPFDSKFIVEWPSNEDIRKRAKELCAEGEFPLAELPARYREMLRRKRKYPKGNPPEVEEGVKMQGVSCFSEAEDCILMWGHYADKHKGVCIGVRFQDMCNHFLLEGFKHVPKSVIYSDNFPQWKIGQDNGKDDVLTAMTTKASCWAYEKEWRIIASRAVGKHCRIPLDCISCVIFGAKTSKEDEIRLLASAYGNGYEPELLKASIRQGKYGLDISPMRVNSYFRVPRPGDA